MIIGICDDNEFALNQQIELCNEYAFHNSIELSIIKFKNGIDVINYCNDENNAMIK